MLEKILGFSIQHRFLVLLLTLLSGIAGGYAMTKLPIDAVPDITNVQVQINTEVPALSPVEMEKQVTFGVETALSGIPGLIHTRSLSRNGFSQVTAVFADGTDIYFARQQVAERLTLARESLPPEAHPEMGPISSGLGEVYMWTVEFAHPEGQGASLAREDQAGWLNGGIYRTPEGQILTTATEKAAYLRTIQDWIIRPQVKSLSGVAGVDAIGGFVKQYHVEPDPMKLMAFGLTFEDIIRALEENNTSTGAGYIERHGEAYLVRSDGRIENGSQIEGLTVGSKDGTPIYIRDVAQVTIGEALRTGSASKNGTETVVGTALMLIGENSRKVAAAVDLKLKSIKSILPPDIIVTPVLNRTKLVDATIATVAKNLIEGAILVIAILFLLLGNMRAALITAAAIPLSMLMTSIGMVQRGISGNLMSLGAIDFGLIVDGAVIIVENCLRRLGDRQRESGAPLTLRERLEEVFEGSREVIKPSVFGQAIIIVVYLPILSLTGIEGKTFHPMAMTVILALLAAFVLSITFVPAMVALWIRGHIEEKENRIFAYAKRGYQPILRIAIDYRRWLFLGSILLCFLSLGLFTTLGQEFVPTLDEHDLAMQAMRIPSTGITQSTEFQRAIEKRLAKLPEVAFVFSKTGTAEVASDPMPPNLSDTFMILKPRTQWPDPKKTKDDLQKQMNEAAESVAGSLYEFTQPIQMRFNELIAGVRSDLAVKIYGDDFTTMGPIASEIAQVLQTVPGASDVKVEQIEGLPVINVKVRRDALARYGLTMEFVQNVLSIAVGGREAGLVFEGDRRFPLMVRLPETLRASAEDLAQLPIPLPRTPIEPSFARVNNSGHKHDTLHRDSTVFMALGELADIEIVEGPNQISRENGKRRIVVQANIRGRDIGSFVNEAQHRIERSVHLGAGQWLEWGGQYENLVAARQRLAVVVPVCFGIIFIILFSAYNSAKFALVIFSGVPLALSGAIIALAVRGMPFSISAAVGLIALSGIAVLNGLVMVSFINQLRAKGEPLLEAVRLGSLTRLRPVLMTALVASLGFLPMAMATGTGAEVQRPLATAVIGGLITSTLLTLLVLPGLYLIFEEGLRWRRAPRVEETLHHGA